MTVNAFCTAEPTDALERADRVIYCGNAKVTDDRIEKYTPFSQDISDGEKRIYLPDMTDFDAFECACDYLLDNDARAIVRAAYDLTEAGIVEAKFKLSPIMLLHKLGVLDRCIIAGGVCLDNDDLDLMAQEGISLVVTPTASAGGGHGYAPVFAASKRGIRVGVGTGDGRFNRSHDIAAEIEFLKLTSAADLRRADVFSSDDTRKFSEFSL